jgi:hypothetical protein
MAYSAMSNYVADYKIQFFGLKDTIVIFLMVTIILTFLLSSFSCLMGFIAWLALAELYLKKPYKLYLPN